MQLNQTSFLRAMAGDHLMDPNFEWNADGKATGSMNAKLGPTERFQLNQALEKRGGIRFNYAPTNRVPTSTVVWIPFYENPTIVESRKANYASKKILLRNEPVRLYTGSEARRFKVDIHYSLIHMAAMVSKEDMFDIFTPRGFDYTDILAIAMYLRDTVGRDTGTLGDASKVNATLFQQAYDRGHSTEGPWGPNRWWKDPSNPREGAAYWSFALLWVMRCLPNWVKHHQILQKVVNNIRSAVIGTQQMPVKGPPIVELKWGTMYNFTPCIITDYKIQPVENAGYDAKSLTAQRLKVSLSLEEMRNINGNLWGDPEIGGDLPGWDSIMQLGTIDPLSDSNLYGQKVRNWIWRAIMFGQS